MKFFNKKTFLAPVFAFLGLFIITIGIFVFIKNEEEKLLYSDFISQTEKIDSSIKNRLNLYTNLLLSGKAFFDSSQEVDRNEWFTYVDTFKIEQRYPGIQGFGYSVWLDPEDVAAHVDSVIDEGFPDYKIKPEGERDQYTAIVFLEPFDERNREAFGFDMYQEANRKNAMNRALLTGKESLSGKVTLVQEIDEDVQSGFLIYVPVYKKGVDLSTSEKRKEAIQGFVYSPFRMNNFISGIIPVPEQSEIIIEIFDNYQSDAYLDENKMYGKESEDPIFSRTKKIDFGGHAWTVRYSTHHNFGKNNTNNSIFYIVIILGFSLSVLFATVIYAFNTRKDKAISLAESMTNDLKTRIEDNEKISKKLEVVNIDLKKKSDLLSKKIEDMEKYNKLMVGREMKMIELKDELKKKKK